MTEKVRRLPFTFVADCGVISIEFQEGKSLACGECGREKARVGDALTFTNGDESQSLTGDIAYHFYDALQDLASRAGLTKRGDLR